MQPSSLKELENSLNRVYLRIFKAINKEDDYPDNLQAIQHKYNKIVYDNTRSAIQQAVILANEKVNRIFKTQPYLSQSDLDIIKKNTDEQVGSFWRKIMLDIFRKQEQRLTGGATVEDVEVDASLEPPPDLDMSFYLLSVAIGSLYTSLAQTTISKTNELSIAEPIIPRIRWDARMDTKTCQRLSNGGPGCAILNGKEWYANDPSIPIPGVIEYGSHPNCRCLLHVIRE